MKRDSGSPNTTRRGFLKTSAALATGTLPLERGVHAAGSGVIKIGLIGGGGRGSQAAINAMNAGKDVRLVAMADPYGDRLQASRQSLKAARPDRTEVKDDHCFTGFDG